MLRLFDLGEGTERLSFQAGYITEGVRLGFSPDGKAVGAFDRSRLSWWDVATGRRAEPGATRFAAQPAGLSEIASRAAISADGGWQAYGYEKHPGLGHLSWNDDEKQYGGFIDVTQRAKAKTWTWRVSRAQVAPAVAFSADGTRLAGAVRPPPSGGGSILIWAVPQ
jgi:hypothetical protein